MVFLFVLLSSLAFGSSDTCNIFQYTATIDSATCSNFCNGLIKFSDISGGTKPYSFSWSHGSTDSSISSLCMGAYTLTITDANGTSCSKTFNISGRPVPELTISTIPVTCAGDCNGTLYTNVSSAYPYTLSFPGLTESNDTLADLCPGMYPVVADNGCISSDTIEITEPGYLSASESLSHPSCSSCCDGDISVIYSGGVPPYQSSLNPFYSPGTFCNGTYYVSVTDSYGCTLNDTIILSFATSLPDISSQEEFTFSNEGKTLRFSDVNEEYFIADVTGRILQRGKTNSEASLNFKPGNYFLHLKGKGYKLNVN